MSGSESQHNAEIRGYVNPETGNDNYRPFVFFSSDFDVIEMFNNFKIIADFCHKMTWRLYRYIVIMGARVTHFPPNLSISVNADDPIFNNIVENI